MTEHGDGRDPVTTPVGKAMASDISGLRYLMHLASVFDSVREGELDRQLKARGSSVSKDRVLGWLSVHPGSTMNELARGVMIDRTTLTRLLDQLVTDGLVSRGRSPVDRRAVVLNMTELGCDELHAGIEVTNAVNARYQGVLSPEGVGAMCRAFLALLDASNIDDAGFFTLTGRRRQRPGRTVVG